MTVGCHMRDVSALKTRDSINWEMITGQPWPGNSWTWKSGHGPVQIGFTDQQDLLLGDKTNGA